MDGKEGGVSGALQGAQVCITDLETNHDVKYFTEWDYSTSRTIVNNRSFSFQLKTSSVSENNTPTIFR